MCFSASASFGAGIVLSAIGVASIKKTQSTPQILFACIPLIFAIQQITEGFLWLALTHAEFSGLQSITTYLFLFFAQVVWPIWVPYSVYKLQKEEKRKMTQKVLIGIGAFVSVYLAYYLSNYPIEAKVIGYHISYNQDYPPKFSQYVGILYVIATIIPPFISRLKKMWLLGVSILVSYIITTLFYENYFISVWCFFASIISIAVFFVMHQARTSEKATNSVFTVS